MERPVEIPEDEVILLEVEIPISVVEFVNDTTSHNCIPPRTPMKNAIRVHFILRLEVVVLLYMDGITELH